MSGVLAAVSAGAAVGGLALSAYGQAKSGKAGADAANANAQAAQYQAQVARNNQIIAEQQAETETQVGVEQAARKSQEGAAKQAQTKAAIGASGVDVNTGSAKNVQVSERELNNLDTETVLSNAQLRAYGYRAQAANYGAQAGLYGLQGGRLTNEAGYDQTAGYLKAGGTLLSGASVIPTKWFSGDTTQSGGLGASGADVPGGISGNVTGGYSYPATSVG